VRADVDKKRLIIAEAVEDTSRVKADSALHLARFGLENWPKCSVRVRNAANLLDLGGPGGTNTYRGLRSEVPRDAVRLFVRMLHGMPENHLI
jgi:hypothetical protein